MSMAVHCTTPVNRQEANLNPCQVLAIAGFYDLSWSKSNPHASRRDELPLAGAEHRFDVYDLD